MDSTILILMIDFKLCKKKSLPILIQKLDQLDMNNRLYKLSNGIATWGPIKIILTGNPPLNELSRYDRDYIFIDGRAGQKYPENLKDKVPPTKLII